jgi:hypothetical protein
MCILLYGLRFSRIEASSFEVLELSFGIGSVHINRHSVIRLFSAVNPIQPRLRAIGEAIRDF